MQRTWGPGLILVAVLGVLGSPGASRAGAEDPHAAPVVLAKVVEQEVKQGASFVGTVEPRLRSEVDVRAAGYLKELLVEAGDPVKGGQVLARLDTDTLDIRLRAARAELTLRQEALRELQNGSRPEDVQQAEARLAEGRADLDAARWKLGAVQKLRREDKLSEEDLQEAQRAARAAEARLQGLQAALALMKAGPREEEIAQAQARVEAQQAAIAQLQDEEKRHTVVAPYDGFIVKKRTEVGAWLETGGAVVEMMALQKVDVVVPVLEDYVGFLREGMPVHLVIDALASPHVQGKIHRIVPMADARSRTAPVKIRIQNHIEGGAVRILPGMFARVTLPVGDPHKARVAPKDAVVLGGPSPIVYVYDPSTSQVHPVPVRLGVAVGEGIEVDGDVPAGAQVVVRGNERLRQGMKVRQVTGR
jgi:multidrug efflux pump subunit AcrA (membrane-fusion protein)